MEPHPIIIHHDPLSVALDNRTLRCVIERDNRDLLQADILPDIRLGPIREGEDAHTLFGIHTCVVDIPEFRPLIFGIPLLMFIAK